MARRLQFASGLRRCRGRRSSLRVRAGADVDSEEEILAVEETAVSAKPSHQSLAGLDTVQHHGRMQTRRSCECRPTRRVRWVLAAYVVQYTTNSAPPVPCPFSTCPERNAPIIPPCNNPLAPSGRWRKWRRLWRASRGTLTQCARAEPIPASSTEWRSVPVGHHRQPHKSTRQRPHTGMLEGFDTDAVQGIHKLWRCSVQR